MLLSATSKLLASLLASSIASLILALTFVQTVGNSHYLEQRLQATNSYQRLSVALSDELSQGIPGIAASQAQPILMRILTPQVLQAKTTSALDQIQAYYQGDGPAPTIDLTDLAAQAKAAGIPVPADNAINKPITIGVSQNAHKQGNVINALWWSSVAGLILCAAGLIVVCKLRRTWVPLPNMLIGTGILLGVLALLIAVAAGLVSHASISNNSAHAFASLGRDLGVLIAKDIAKRLAAWAVILAAIGVGVRMLLLRGRRNTSNPVMPQSPVESGQTPLIR